MISFLCLFFLLDLSEAGDSMLMNEIMSAGEERNLWDGQHDGGTKHGVEVSERTQGLEESGR